MPVLPDFLRLRVHTEDARVTIDRYRQQQIQRAVEARDGILKGAEWWFTCPNPTSHTNGDRKPSARWNPEKKTYYCDPCAEGGGWTKLERLIVTTTTPVGWPEATPQRPVQRQREQPSHEPVEVVEVTDYNYHAADGTLAFNVVRMSDKSFSQRHPNPDQPGLWIRNMDGVERVPYHLPELIAADPATTVFIAAGEKDVDNLIALGAVATTNPGGEGKWLDAFSVYMEGRSVVVLGDNDDPGLKHVTAVGTSVSSRASSVKVIETFPGLEDVEKSDISDWIATGKTLEDLYRLVDRTPVWVEGNDTGSRALVWHTASEVGRMTPEHVDWCVETIVAQGAITEISGVVKIGKTTFVGSLIQAVLTGEPFINSPTAQAPVVWLTEERAPTFRSMLDRVGLLNHEDLHVLFRYEAGESSWSDVIDAAVEKAHEVGAGMLTIDTLSGWSRLQGDDENSAGAAMTAMEPVHRAAAAGLGVILNRHDRKGGGALGESGRGSSAFAGEVDVLVQIRRPSSPGNPSRREISSTGRFDGIPDTRLVEFKDGRYLYLGDAPNVERKDAKQWLREHLPSADGVPMLKPAIQEGIGTRASNSTINRALEEMVEFGEVGTDKGYGPTKRSRGWWLTNGDLDKKPPKGLGGEKIDSPTLLESGPEQDPPPVPHEKIDKQGETDDLATLSESSVGYVKNHPPIPRGELLDRRPLTTTPNKKSAEESAEGSEQAPNRLAPAGNRNYYGVPAEPETEPAEDESPLPWEDDPDAPSVPKNWWDDDSGVRQRCATPPGWSYAGLAGR